MTETRQKTLQKLIIKSRIQDFLLNGCPPQEDLVVLTKMPPKKTAQKIWVLAGAPLKICAHWETAVNCSSIAANVNENILRIVYDMFQCERTLHCGVYLIRNKTVIL